MKVIGISIRLDLLFHLLNERMFKTNNDKRMNEESLWMNRLIICIRLLVA